MTHSPRWWARKAARVRAIASAGETAASTASWSRTRTSAMAGDDSLAGGAQPPPQARDRRPRRLPGGGGGRRRRARALHARHRAHPRAAGREAQRVAAGGAARADRARARRADAVGRRQRLGLARARQLPAACRSAASPPVVLSTAPPTGGGDPITRGG